MKTAVKMALECVAACLALGVGLSLSAGESSSAVGLPRVNVVNKGYPGCNTRDALAVLARDMLPLKPQHVIVYFGMNDALNSAKLLPLSEYEDNLRKMVQTLRSHGVKDVALVTINPVIESYVQARHPKHPRRDALQSYLATYDCAVRKVAEKESLLLVDLREIIERNGGATGSEAGLIRCEKNGGWRDGVHLTPAAYALLGQCAFKVMGDRVGPGETVVCFGDSLTFGVNVKGAGTAEGETYPAALQRCFDPGLRADGPQAAFKKIQLEDRFYAEGACSADFNRDGKPDVVAGPFWYEGPDFKTKHEVHPPKSFDPHGYSDNFLTYTGDFNDDGWADIFYAPWPGKEGYWYENPAGKDAAWRQHLAFGCVENESPMWGDVNLDGRPDLVFNTDGRLGYATYDPAKPDAVWQFHAVTPKGNYQKYTHGIGFGDIDGDGRVDLLERNGWWEQPAGAAEGQTWTPHPFKFAEAAAQMFAYDVDGDGLNDVITAWECHLYGLVWYRQSKGPAGEIIWQQQVILPAKPDMNSGDLRVSQLHAFALADMNGDGLSDLLTGKRFWAHGPTGDVEAGAPAVVYWFELQRKPGQTPRFIPHLIDDNSGVGTQVAAADLNGDGTPDVIVSNKKGSFLHLSQRAEN